MAVDRWSKFDDSAKEQEIAGYAVTNLKYTQELFKHFELTLGVDMYCRKDTGTDIGIERWAIQSVCSK